MADTLDVTCPCCGTQMTLDASTGAVLSEKRPRRSKSFEDALVAEREREHTLGSAFKKATGLAPGAWRGARRTARA